MLLTLLFLSIGLAADATAVSVGAGLAAGVTLPLLNVHVVPAAAVIGGVTFVLCFGGALLGHRLGARIGPKLNAMGGLILIGLGIKTVLEHVARR